MALTAVPMGFETLIKNWEEQAQQIQALVPLSGPLGYLSLKIAGAIYRVWWPLYSASSFDLIVITPQKQDGLHDVLRWPGNLHLGDQLWEAFLHDYVSDCWDVVGADVTIESAITFVQMECT